MTIQTNINSPEPVNLSIHGSITLPRVEGFIFRDMKKQTGTCVEIDGVFYESIKYAGRVIGHDKETIKRRCLSNKFPNYKIVPFRITYTEKRCTKCGKMKLLNEFCVDKRHKDNLSSECKGCYQMCKRENRKTNIAYKVNSNMRTAIWLSLKSKKDGAPWESLVDYTVKELIAHLKKQFTEGMSRDNYGAGKHKWSLDHIIAKSKFNITSLTCQEFKDCWSLDNLQPLWHVRNMEKKDKPIHPKYLIKPDWIK